MMYLKNEFWGTGGHLFDIHASLWASHHDRTITGTVHEDGKISLSANVQGLCNHHLDMTKSERVHDWQEVSVILNQIWCHQTHVFYCFSTCSYVNWQMKTWIIRLYRFKGMCNKKCLYTQMEADDKNVWKNMRNVQNIFQKGKKYWGAEFIVIEGSYPSLFLHLKAAFLFY